MSVGKAEKHFFFLNAVKSLKFIPSFTLSKAAQWVSLWQADSGPWALRLTVAWHLHVTIK